MALQLVELFGYAPQDPSPEAAAAREHRSCPFLKRECVKNVDGRPSGACSVRQRRDSQPVICCPARLYADQFEPIAHIADVCFGSPSKLISGIEEGEAGFANVLAFGKGLAGELRIPMPGRVVGGFSVDWILAHTTLESEILSIAAVEVQTIDTTGSYGALVEALIAGRVAADDYGSCWADAGLNWENVNKRILPQLIYKGHALRRENKNSNGLFFVCPKPVYEKIAQRLGDDLMTYQRQPGALTFVTYDLGPAVESGRIRPLQHTGMNTTTVDQAALAFTAPRNLPEANSYLRAIEARLARRRGRGA